jgi:hypothetical protein
MRILKPHMGHNTGSEQASPSAGDRAGDLVASNPTGPIPIRWALSKAPPNEILVGLALLAFSWVSHLLGGLPGGNVGADLEFDWIQPFTAQRFFRLHPVWCKLHCHVTRLHQPLQR